MSIGTTASPIMFCKVVVFVQEFFPNLAYNGFVKALFTNYLERRKHYGKHRIDSQSHLLRKTQF